VVSAVLYKTFCQGLQIGKAANHGSRISESGHWGGKIGKVKKLYDTTLKKYDSAAAKFKSSKRKREGLLKKFKQWK